MQQQARRVMLVDDEPSVLSALGRALRAGLEGVSIEPFSDPAKAAERLGEAAFDLVVSDIRMPLMDGATFLALARSIQPGAVRVALSAHCDFQALARTLNEGEVWKFLGKPWDNHELVSLCREGFALRDELATQRRLADERRVETGDCSAREAEARRLEELEPGITTVVEDEDGCVLLDANLPGTLPAEPPR